MNEYFNTLSELVGNMFGDGKTDKSMWFCMPVLTHVQSLHSSPNLQKDKEFLSCLYIHTTHYWIFTHQTIPQSTLPVHALEHFPVFLCKFTLYSTMAIRQILRQDQKRHQELEFKRGISQFMLGRMKITHCYSSIILEPSFISRIVEEELAQL